MKRIFTILATLELHMTASVKYLGLRPINKSNFLSCRTRCGTLPSWALSHYSEVLAND